MIDFNTVNPSLSTGKDFLTHSLYKNLWWEDVRTPPKLGIGKSTPSALQISLGKSLGSWWIDGFPNTKTVYTKTGQDRTKLPETSEGMLTHTYNIFLESTGYEDIKYDDARCEIQFYPKYIQRTNLLTGVGSRDTCVSKKRKRREEERIDCWMAVHLCHPNYDKKAQRVWNESKQVEHAASQMLPSLSFYSFSLSWK